LRRASIIATTVATAALVAGCGGSSPGGASLTADSSSAHKLLVQTFEGHHKIKSGVISFALKVVPSGSSTITQPLELSVDGPFTNSAAGKLPQSDFTIALSVQGHTAELQVISAGGKGYITLSGQSFELPASSYSKLKSGLGSLAGSSVSSRNSNKSGTGTLGQLGIRPLDWVKQPRIAGSATVAGAATTHIAARVDAGALLHDLGKLVGSASSLTGTGAAGAVKQGISAAEQRSIANALRSPQLNVWTGTGDQVLRKLTFTATIPVSGATSTQLGSMTGAVVTFSLQYSHINQPQTITAPSSVQPYSVFRSEVSTLLQEIEGGLGTSTTSGSATTSGTTTTAGGFTGTIQSGTSTVSNAAPGYTRCIIAAKGDVSKMQKCSKLLTTH
jgi:hypothetical protein